MTINEFVQMQKRIHDEEGWNLGTNSSRDTRNKFMEFCVGCAHWGHPKYNLSPDPQWHCKDPDGDGGRPMSDDVIVSMPSRNFWDTIPNAGADGYSFKATFDGVLDPAQVVFVPKNPNKKNEGSNPIVPSPQLKSRDQFYVELREINEFYASFDGLQRPGGMVINGAADVEALGAWGYNLMLGKTVEQCKNEIRNSFEWKAKH
jgi:hypothetical protein